MCLLILKSTHVYSVLFNAAEISPYEEIKSPSTNNKADKNYMPLIIDKSNNSNNYNNIRPSPEYERVGI